MLENLRSWEARLLGDLQEAQVIVTIYVTASWVYGYK